MTTVEEDLGRGERAGAEGHCVGATKDEGYTVRVVPVGSLSDLDVARWDDLARRAISPNALVEPACILPAAQHLRNGSTLVLLVAERAGRFEFVAPLQRVPRWHSIPRPAWTTRVRRMTWDATPLVDAEHSEEAVTAVLDAFARGEVGSARLLVLEWLNELGPIGEHVRQACATHGLRLRTAERWQQPFAERQAENTYRHKHSKKYLKERARLRRALGTELGGDVELVDRGGDPDAVEAFLELEAAGYKGASGVATVTQPGEREWLLELTGRLGAVGRLHLLSLEVDGRPVAMELLARAGRGIAMWKIAHDEAFDRFSPGTLLMLDTFDWFHEQTDASYLDCCTFAGNQALLHQFPDRRDVSTLVIARRGWRSGAALGLLGLDRAFRALAFTLGRLLRLEPATVSLFCDGGDFGARHWRQARSRRPER